MTPNFIDKHHLFNVGEYCADDILAKRFYHALLHPDVLPENPPHFFDRLGMALSRVAGAYDFFRLHSIDVRAFVSDDSVSLAGNRSLAKHGDNRVGRYAGINRCA